MVKKTQQIINLEPKLLRIKRLGYVVHTMPPEADAAVPFDITFGRNHYNRQRRQARVGGHVCNELPARHFRHH